jgi:hypothetical protein
VNGSDAPEQISVVARAFRWTARDPRVVTTGGDLQQPGHRRDRQGGLVRFHEFEPFSGTVPVSRANQAAAFDKISAQA